MSQSHAPTIKGYLIGFVLALILSVIPFWLVMEGGLTPRTTAVLIFSFAVAQVFVHLRSFLHLGWSKDGKLNTMALAFTGLVIFMLVGLSVWILFSANALMM
ncbi:cytochrome o ubiquinol oxidase subunit IV [Jeongeupia wiesaeckerbachi]|uniref:cytochrome o ubiquinol oxidase subunit IV n=1 Tax=Jeongeupia wiesaeckerbachi TaxID=3051218 RepID=UPI003D80A350